MAVELKPLAPRLPRLVEADRKSNNAHPQPFLSFMEKLSTINAPLQLSPKYRIVDAKALHGVDVTLQAVVEGESDKAVPFLVGNCETTVDLAKICLPKDLVESLCRANSSFRNSLEQNKDYTNFDTLIQPFQKSCSVYDLFAYFSRFHKFMGLLDKIRFASARIFTGFMPKDPGIYTDFSETLMGERCLRIRWNSDGSIFSVNAYMDLSKEKTVPLFFDAKKDVQETCLNEVLIFMTKAPNKSVVTKTLFHRYQMVREPQSEEGQPDPDPKETLDFAIRLTQDAEGALKEFAQKAECAVM